MSLGKNAGGPVTVQNPKHLLVVCDLEKRVAPALAGGHMTKAPANDMYSNAVGKKFGGAMSVSKRGNACIVVFQGMMNSRTTHAKQQKSTVRQCGIILHERVSPRNTVMSSSHT
jgi:hypothetical protein